MEEPSNLQGDENNQMLSPLKAIAIQYENCDSDVESASSNSKEAKKETDLQEKRTTGVEEEKEYNKEVEIVTISDETNYRTNTQDNNSSDKSDSENSSDTDDSSDSSSDIDDSDVNEKSTACNTNKNRDNTINQVSQDEPKNEFEDLPPIEDLKISVPEVLCDPFGEVAWTVEQMVVVRPKEGKPTLNLDTVLFVDRGQRALGKIFDVFGQVSEPHYCVRFNSPKHIEENNVKVGMIVYYCPNTQYTSLVFLHELVKMKGSDAVDEDEPPEFSDDEEERVYYESLRRKTGQNKINEDVPPKRKRKSAKSTGWQSNHPWNENRRTQMQKRGTHRAKDNNGCYTDNNGCYTDNNGCYTDNTWPSSSYSCPNDPYWTMVQGPVYPAYVGNGYQAYSNELQSTNQESSSNNSHENYYNRNHPPPYNPRQPFGVPPQFPPSIPPNCGLTFPLSNARFSYMDPHWQSHMMMPFPVRASWGAPPTTSLPPVPPQLLPPPPPQLLPPPPHLLQPPPPPQNPR